jgi:hypothetical protein
MKKYMVLGVTYSGKDYNEWIDEIRTDDLEEARAELERLRNVDSDGEYYMLEVIA